MRQILFLLPDLDYHGRNRQATLLAPALPRDRFAVRGFSRSGPGPFADLLQQADIPLFGQAGHRVINAENLRLLRHLLVSDRPALIHAWGLDALRFLWWASLLKLSLLPPLVVSMSASSLKKNRLRWWERWLLECVRAVVVDGEAERSALLAAGLAAEKVRIVRPGVSIPQEPSSTVDFRTEQGVANGDRLFMMVGHINSPERFRDGFQAFDTMRGIDPSLHLFLIGDGPYRQRLVDFTEFAARPGLGIHFLGARLDAPALLKMADIVLITHRRMGGTYAVLESLAAGRPAIAARLPHLTDLIRDGETGLLVPPGNPAALVRAMSRLLNDEKLRQTIGAAALSEAETYFSAARMATDFSELYDEILKR